MEKLLLDSGADNNRIICITNKENCKGDFIKQIELVAKRRPKAIVLREKYLPKNEYVKLACECMRVCRKFNVPLIWHSHLEEAILNYADGIHLPFNAFCEWAKEEPNIHRADLIKIIGVSIHSKEEAKLALKLGATYIMAGNIYETACKVGVMGKGTKYLQEIVKAVKIPVYGIGGISASNIDAVLQTGAAGVCIMSETNKYQ